MGGRSLALRCVVVVAIAVAGAAAAVPVAGQQSGSRASMPWTAPRTPDGQPDLQGVWANNVVTPLQRPLQLGGRARLTDEELAALKAHAAELFTGDGDAAFVDDVFVAALTKAKDFKSTDAGTGNYNHFWLAERTFDNRTSLIDDPADGRIPPLTREGEKRQAAGGARRKAHPADGPEDRALSERCVTFGVPNVFAGYNSNVQILQSRDYVVIVHEMIHDARLIPLDGRPHIGQGIRRWLGDSRGRWEGETLVIETTNFRDNAFQVRDRAASQGSSEKLRLIERLTRVDAATLQYEFTVEDPMTWTKPWSAMIPWQKAGDKIYEYACHEGNLGMFGILSGHRAQEQAGPRSRAGASR